jgi:hypothetical protein
MEKSPVLIRDILTPSHASFAITLEGSDAGGTHVFAGFTLIALIPNFDHAAKLPTVNAVWASDVYHASPPARPARGARSTDFLALVKAPRLPSP